VDTGRVDLRGPGRPLPEPVRERMERAFGQDFSAVRVHVGPQAASLGAFAFTMGEGIWFAPGQWQPTSPRGLQLLGHELAHVVQQRQGRVKAPGGGVHIVQDKALEAEAERMGALAAARAAAAPVPQRRSAGGRSTLQRYEVVRADALADLAETSREDLLEAQTWSHERGFLGDDDHTAAMARSALRDMRVSDDGKLAIEDSDLKRRQPKCFFATADLLERSNAALVGIKADVRLRSTGQSLTLSWKAERRQLLQIVPEMAGKPESPVLLPQLCNKIAESVSGIFNVEMRAPRGPTRKDLKGTADIEDEYVLAHEVLAQLQSLTGRMKEFETFFKDFHDSDPSASETRKAILVRLTRRWSEIARDASHDELMARYGLNRHATPATGEILKIKILDPAPVYKLLNDLEYAEVQDYVSGGKSDVTWSYHYATAVATSGDAYVTLENYARQSSEPRGDTANDPRWYFQMYGGKSGQSFHEANVASGGYPNAMTTITQRPSAPPPPKPVARPQPKGPSVSSGWVFAAAVGVAVAAFLYLTQRDPGSS
jgi:hypothetical protein